MSWIAMLCDSVKAGTPVPAAVFYLMEVEDVDEK
jgi:hypothetical protein